MVIYETELFLCCTVFACGDTITSGHGPEEEYSKDVHEISDQVRRESMRKNLWP
jgi:hypothetical protein